MVGGVERGGQRGEDLVDLGLAVVGDLLRRAHIHGHWRLDGGARGPRANDHHFVQGQRRRSELEVGGHALPRRQRDPLLRGVVADEPRAHGVHGLDDEVDRRCERRRRFRGDDGSRHGTGLLRGKRGCDQECCQHGKDTVRSHGPPPRERESRWARRGLEIRSRAPDRHRGRRVPRARQTGYPDRALNHGRAAPGDGPRADRTGGDRNLSDGSRRLLEIARAVARPPRSAVLTAVIGTRLPVLLLGALAVTLVGTIPAPTAEALWRVSPNELANLQARWDTDFYYSIATTGYHWNPAVFLHQNVVFFPLYPLLMRWGGALLGGHPLLAGTIVSLAAFAGAISVLYRLAAHELGEEKAWPVILLMSTYPVAMFYSVSYTESFFLFLTVSSFYAMRRGYLLPAAMARLSRGL